MKICFIGTHGVGKSFAALQKAAALKKEYPHKSVSVLEENVRELKRALNGELNTPSFQRLCILDQYKNELIATHVHDIVVCDRSTIDPLIYAQELGVEVTGDFIQLALNNMRSFDEIYFVRPDNGLQEIVDDGFRHTDLAFRNSVDDLFEQFLKRHNIKHIEITTKEIYK